MGKEIEKQVKKKASKERPGPGVMRRQTLKDCLQDQGFRTFHLLAKGDLVGYSSHLLVGIYCPLVPPGRKIVRGVSPNFRLPQYQHLGDIVKNL